MKRFRPILILVTLSLVFSLAACGSGGTTTQDVVEADAKAGDLVTYGRTEQDDNRADGKEPIVWRVLEVRDGQALLLSDKNLDAKAYNTSESNLTWATSTLRAWLNKDFLNDAFTKSEASAIVQTTLENPDNPTYGTSGGDATIDRVFLLSIEDARNYFTTDESRVSLNTVYAIAQGADDIDGAGWWWLRTPGLYRSAACVSRDGSVFEGGRATNDDRSAIRPAMWVKMAA
jgi:hypothetical protein